MMLKHTKQLLCRGLVVCGLIAGFGVTVQAAVLVPGGAIALSGTTSAARPELAGTVIYDVLIPFQIDINGFPGNPLYQGNLQNRVVRSNIDGTLDFYYRIRDTNGGLNGILASAETDDFTGWSTDVDYRTDGLGSKETTRAERSAAGDLVTLLYGNSVFGGEESLFTFIKTDATQFTTGGQTTLKLGGGESITLDTVMPDVPEPATLALLVLGVSVVLYGRRSDSLR